MSTNCSVSLAIRDLDKEDWRKAWRNNSVETRRALARLLNVAASAKVNPGFLALKAAAVGDEGAHLLAALLASWATKTAVELLGDSANDPAADDLRRIWPAWTSRCGQKLAVLSLIVTIDEDHKAAGSAREVLNELNLGAEVPAVVTTFSESHRDDGTDALDVKSDGPQVDVKGDLGHGGARQRCRVEKRPGYGS